MPEISRWSDISFNPQKKLSFGTLSLYRPTAQGLARWSFEELQVKGRESSRDRGSKGGTLFQERGSALPLCLPSASPLRGSTDFHPLGIKGRSNAAGNGRFPLLNLKEGPPNCTSTLIKPRNLKSCGNHRSVCCRPVTTSNSTPQHRAQSFVKARCQA